MTTADGASTTPVKRGVWLGERILGKTIPQPPKEIAGIEQIPLNTALGSMHLALKKLRPVLEKFGDGTT